MSSRAVLYDGQSALRQDVLVAALDGRLTIEFADGETEQIDPSELRRLESQAGAIRIARPTVPGWRLLLPGDADPPLLELIADDSRYGGWIDKVGLVPAAVAFGIVAAAVVVVGYAAPQWVAPHVPASWERNLGAAIVGDFGDNRCASKEGQQALDAMVERLSPGAMKGPAGIKAAALDVSMFNAAALPGGYIVLFKPIITETEPDELAGIVAHELAHVRRRHVTEALIRELGIGALIRLFAGNVGANASELVALSYTRENEADADAEAIAMLRRARVSPLPTARLFQRLAKEEGEGPGMLTAEFLSSHPLSGARAKRFAAAFDPQQRYQPVLTRDQSDALFNICWKGPLRR